MQHVRGATEDAAFAIVMRSDLRPGFAVSLIIQFIRHTNGKPGLEL